MQRSDVIWSGKSFALGLSGRSQLQERDRGRESFTDLTVAAVFVSVTHRRVAGNDLYVKRQSDSLEHGDHGFWSGFLSYRFTWSGRRDHSQFPFSQLFMEFKRSSPSARTLRRSNAMDRRSPSVSDKAIYHFRSRAFRSLRPSVTRLSTSYAVVAGSVFSRRISVRSSSLVVWSEEPTSSSKFKRFAAPRLPSWFSVLSSGKFGTSVARSSIGSAQSPNVESDQSVRSDLPLSACSI
jgi:hypothetical protein